MRGIINSRTRVTRRVMRVLSSVRRVSKTERERQRFRLRPEDVQAGYMELDSHADTTVLGKNCIVLNYTERECDVAPYSDEYQKMENIPVVTGATAWTCQETGETVILVFHEALWFGDRLDHSLINPNQVRHNGLELNDNPYGHEPMGMTLDDVHPFIPFASAGTTIFFDTRTPTADELENCRHMVMTSKHPWNPHDVCFPNGSTRHEQGENSGISSIAVKALKQHQIREQHNGTDTEAGVAGTVYDPVEFSIRLINNVKVSATDAERHRMEDVPDLRTFHSKARKTSVDPRDLAEKWGISFAKAAKTLKATTQRMLRSALLPLSRRYRADRMFERPRIKGTMYSDTYIGNVVSLDGNRYAQVFANESHFIKSYPMEKKSLAGDALKQFISDYGVPDKLVVDGSKEQTKRGTEFYQQCRKHNIDLHQIEPYRHNQSKVEGVIREARKRWFRLMAKKKVPHRLWDYGLQWVCETSQLTASEAGNLNGRTALEQMTGETPDISEYLDFGFYDWVWVHENAGLGERKLGRWLGVSHRVGSLMSYWVLTHKGTVISRTSVQPVTNLELMTPENKAECAGFDKHVAEKLSDKNHTIDSDSKTQPLDWSDYKLEDDPDFREEFFDVVDSDEVPEADDYSPEVGDDSYINMEVQIPRVGYDYPQRGRVTKRMKDENGNPIGTADPENIIFDTRLYEVEFPDGETMALAANYISENLFSQVNDDGDRFILLRDIVDYRIKSTAVTEDDAFITTRSGTKRRRFTTKGVELLCEFVDGLTQWVTLKDMKESYPVQVAEYAVQAGIDHLPAFAWWVPYTLKKREAIIAKVKSKYWERTHKFGIRIPKSVPEARQIDKDNQNTLWWDAICMEMKNVRIAFEKWTKGEEDIPPGFTEIKCHMVFDVKLGENFRRKARMVAGGHMTDTPAALTYSSVVARDSVRICLMLAALNGLDVRACDIQNAYLTAPCREKVWTRAGEEFGSDSGCIMIVVRALYGLKSSGAAFRAHLADRLYEMGFTPSRGDPDVWMRPAVKSDGEEYYEYVLVYVDDCMSISENADGVLKEVQATFKLKGDKIEEPTTYLGAKLGQMEVGAPGSGIMAWSTSAEDFVTTAVQDVERELASKGMKLPKKCGTPLPSTYRPDQDVTPELKKNGHTRYQEMVGVLRWACELGRVDILQETSLMSSYLACPREGHLQRLYNMFGYLKTMPKRKICLDPRYPNIDPNSFAEHDWYDFYRDAEEKIPKDAPKPRGKYVTVHVFVDANHAGCQKTRKSVTGILIFVNMAPVIFYSKKQNTVEASTFGAEFVAMRTAVELVESLRMKLRYFGVPIEGPADVFCDNESVFKNVSTPESTLKKKHLSICYHRSREAVAAGVIRVAKEHTSTNLADLFTKSLDFDRREELLDYFTY